MPGQFLLHNQPHTYPYLVIHGRSCDQVITLSVISALGSSPACFQPVLVSERRQASKL